MKRNLAVVVVVFASIVMWSLDAEAQQRRRAPATTAATAEIPVQIGVGPVGFMFGAPTYPDLGFGGLVFDDQPLHTGLRIDLTAVVDADLVRQHPGLVPREYESRVIQAGEVRYAPGITSLIPSNLYFSPPIGDAMAFGSTWSLMGLGLAITPSPARLSLGASVIGTLMYLNTPATAATHYIFARPGAEINIDFELLVTQKFLISLGWASQVYVPQSIDGTGLSMLGLGGFDERSIWHIGQFYIQGHFRVPYTHSYRSTRRSQPTQQQPRQQQPAQQQESQPTQQQPTQQEQRRPVPQAPQPR